MKNFFKNLKFFSSIVFHKIFRIIALIFRFISNEVCYNLRRGGIMAKFSFHCQCYKAGQLGGIDKHNRRLNKNYISNPDIDTERSGQNRIYIAPKQSLYKDCKEQIEKRVVASGGRITKASNWICEAVFSYPEELPLERLDKYND